MYLIQIIKLILLHACILVCKPHMKQLLLSLSSFSFFSALRSCSEGVDNDTKDEVLNDD